MQAAHLAHGAKIFTSAASDAVEDGVHAAKRAVTRGARSLAFGAGVVLGMIGCGVAFAARARQKAGEV